MRCKPSLLFLILAASFLVAAVQSQGIDSYFDALNERGFCRGKKTFTKSSFGVIVPHWGNGNTPSQRTCVWSIIPSDRTTARIFVEIHSNEWSGALYLYPNDDKSKEIVFESWRQISPNRSLTINAKTLTVVWIATSGRNLNFGFGWSLSWLADQGALPKPCGDLYDPIKGAGYVKDWQSLLAARRGATSVGFQKCTWSASTVKGRAVWVTVKTNLVAGDRLDISPTTPATWLTSFGDLFMQAEKAIDTPLTLTFNTNQATSSGFLATFFSAPFSCRNQRNFNLPNTCGIISDHVGYGVYFLNSTRDQHCSWYIRQTNSSKSLLFYFVDYNIDQNRGDSLTISRLPSVNEALFTSGAPTLPPLIISPPSERFSHTIRVRYFPRSHGQGFKLVYFYEEDFASNSTKACPGLKTWSYRSVESDHRHFSMPSGSQERSILIRLNTSRSRKRSPGELVLAPNNVLDRNGAGALFISTFLSSFRARADVQDTLLPKFFDQLAVVRWRPFVDSPFLSRSAQIRLAAYQREDILFETLGHLQKMSRTTGPISHVILAYRSLTQYHIFNGPNLRAGSQETLKLLPDLTYPDRFITVGSCSNFFFVSSETTRLRTGEIENTIHVIDIKNPTNPFVLFKISVSHQDGPMFGHIFSVSEDCSQLLTTYVDGLNAVIDIKPSNGKAVAKIVHSTNDYYSWSWLIHFNRTIFYQAAKMSKDAGLMIGCDRGNVKLLHLLKTDDVWTHNDEDPFNFGTELDGACSMDHKSLSLDMTPDGSYALIGVAEKGTAYLVDLRDVRAKKPQFVKNVISNPKTSYGFGTWVQFGRTDTPNQEGAEVLIASEAYLYMTSIRIIKNSCDNMDNFTANIIGRRCQREVFRQFFPNRAFSVPFQMSNLYLGYADSHLWFLPSGCQASKPSSCLYWIGRTTNGRMAINVVENGVSKSSIAYKVSEETCPVGSVKVNTDTFEPCRMCFNNTYRDGKLGTCVPCGNKTYCPIGSVQKITGYSKPYFSQPKFTATKGKHDMKKYLLKALTVPPQWASILLYVLLALIIAFFLFLHMKVSNEAVAHFQEEATEFTKKLSGHKHPHFDKASQEIHMVGDRRGAAGTLIIYVVVILTAIYCLWYYSSYSKYTSADEYVYNNERASGLSPYFSVKGDSKTVLQYLSQKGFTLRLTVIGTTMVPGFCLNYCNNPTDLVTSNGCHATANRKPCHHNATISCRLNSPTNCSITWVLPRNITMKSYATFQFNLGNTYLQQIRIDYIQKKESVKIPMETSGQVDLNTNSFYDIVRVPLKDSPQSVLFNVDRAYKFSPVLRTSEQTGFFYNGYDYQIENVFQPLAGSTHPGFVEELDFLEDSTGNNVTITFEKTEYFINNVEKRAVGWGSFFIITIVAMIALHHVVHVGLEFIFMVYDLCVWAYNKATGKEDHGHGHGGGHGGDHGGGHGGIHGGYENASHKI